MNRRDVLIGTAAAVVAAAAPATAVPAAAPWRVFRVSEYEWYVARSAFEALQAAAADWGCQDAWADLGALLEDLEKEGLTDEEPEDVGDAGLDRLHFVDVDEDERTLEGSRRTFRAELERRIADGLDAPELFATTEW